ncbi:MAG: TolC family protein [Desulfosporosinus sp.]
MKKIIRITVLLSMLILGQTSIVYAGTTDSGVLNFEDIKSIIIEQNTDVKINQNDRLKSHVAESYLKKNIKDLKDDLEDINDQRDNAGGNLRIALGAEKRAILDAIKELERNLEDLPLSISSTDVKASMSDDTQIRIAEGAFIQYNGLEVASSELSRSINTVQNQLVVMQLRERLGMVSHNEVDALKTQLMDMQTKLESCKLQQEESKRELGNLLNQQDDTLEIGSIPVTNEGFVIEDKEADLNKALENSYTIKLQEEQIVNLQNTLTRAKKDHGLSSNEYKQVSYDLDNANLTLAQQKDTLKSDYSTIIDDIVKKQSCL